MSSDWSWTRKDDPKKVADTMFREVRQSASRARLTWSREEMDSTERYDAGKVGEFRPKLPYIKIHNRWIVQNCRLMDRGGNVLYEGDPPVPEDIVIDALDRHYVNEALAKFKEKALEADPKLCRECGLFRAETYEDQIKHLYHEHPDRMKEIVGLASSGQTVEPEPVADDAPKKHACPCGEFATNSLEEFYTHSKSHRKAG